MRKLLTVLFVLIFAAHAYGQTRIKPDRLQLDAQPWRYGPIYAPTGEFFLHRLGADILDATAISLPSDIWIQNATFGTAAAETLNVTGNITVDGTVDGEDVAGLGTRLDDYDSAGVILGSSSVTDLSDVTKAGSGAIISATERVIIENLDAADIILAGSSVTDLSDVSDAGSGIIISAVERESLNDLVSANIILAGSSVADLSDVSSAGSGQIITADERISLESLVAADIILSNSSVTDLADVSDAGSGIIISAAERVSLNASESRLDAYDSAGVILPASSVTDLADVTKAGSGAIISATERALVEGSLQKNGTVALTADWNAGNYTISSKVLGIAEDYAFMVNSSTAIALNPQNALNSIVMGYGNSAAPALHHESGSSGYNNTIIGTDAGKAMTIGYNNSIFGTQAVYSATDTYGTVAVGSYALENYIGIQNTALGYGTLRQNTSGSFNIGIGYQAGYFNRIGNYNVIVGTQAGQGNSGDSYSYNTFLGGNSGLANSTGAQNTFLGCFSGDNNTTGSGNIIIGYDEDNLTASTSNHLNIGGVIYGNLSSGFIGIATNTPTVELEVNGDCAADTFIELSLSSAKENIESGTDSLSLLAATDRVCKAPIKVYNLKPADAPTKESIRTELISNWSSTSSLVFGSTVTYEAVSKDPILSKKLDSYVDYVHLNEYAVWQKESNGKKYAQTRKGFIADWNETPTEYVANDINGNPKGIQWSAVVADLVLANQQLLKEVEDLKGRIAKLERQ